MDLELHPQKGLNPHMTYCPRCGEDAEEIILLGANDNLYRCGCGKSYVGKSSIVCKSCRTRMKFERQIRESEKLPASDICNKCKDADKAVRKEVERGGIYWHCVDCGAAGAIKAEHPMSASVRKHMKISAPKPCGVEFTKKECPMCGEG